jgi:hypothetical protein
MKGKSGCNEQIRPEATPNDIKSCRDATNAIAADMPPSNITALLPGICVLLSAQTRPDDSQVDTYEFEECCQV